MAKTNQAEFGLDWKAEQMAPKGPSPKKASSMVAVSSTCCSFLTDKKVFKFNFQNATEKKKQTWHQKPNFDTRFEDIL